VCVCVCVCRGRGELRALGAWPKAAHKKKADDKKVELRRTRTTQLTSVVSVVSPSSVHRHDNHELLLVVAVGHELGFNVKCRDPKAVLGRWGWACGWLDRTHVSSGLRSEEGDGRERERIDGV
jgi:hypothetical protein